jgi:hypothetical protein
MKNGVLWNVAQCGFCKNRRFVTLTMEALSTSDKSDLTRATRRNIPEDAIFIYIIFSTPILFITSSEQVNIERKRPTEEGETENDNKSYIGTAVSFQD